MATRPFWALAPLLLLALACCPRAFAIISSNVCYPQWQITDWTVAQFGPITMCAGNATVLFEWPSTEVHGVFQIPDDACPSNYTSYATDNYRELAGISQGGSFTWQLPSAPGDYWVTSQSAGDCFNGMLAHFVLTDQLAGSGLGAKVSSAGGLGASPHMLAAAGAALLAAVIAGGL